MKTLSLIALTLVAASGAQASEVATLMGHPDGSLKFVQEMVERKIDLVEGFAEKEHTTILYSVLRDEGVQTATSVSITPAELRGNVKLIRAGLTEGSKYADIVVTYFGTITNKSLCDQMTAMTDKVFVIPAGLAAQQTGEVAASCYSPNIVRVGQLNQELNDLADGSARGELVVSIAAPGYAIPVVEVGGRRGLRTGPSLSLAIVAGRLAAYAREHVEYKGEKLVNEFYKAKSVRIETLDGQVNSARALLWEEK